MLTISGEPGPRLPVPAVADRQFIGGRWRAGRSEHRLTVSDPFTSEPISEIQLAAAADVDDAFRVAEAAQVDWAATPPRHRRAVFERALRWVDAHHRAIVELIVRELGGTRPRAAYEINFVTEFLRFAAALCTAPAGQLLPAPERDVENRVYNEPVGVVSVISPFNVPFFLSVKAAAPALALGNAVVLKPHDLTPLTGGALVAQMFDAAGLPAGLLNVVIADVAEIGDAMVTHPAAQLVVFTGSTGTGRHIAEVAGRHLKPVVLELGGNSALVVLDDADVDAAVDAAVFGRCVNAGQACMAVNRIVADHNVHDELVERYIARLARLPVGDPRQASTVIGPLISPGHADQLENQVRLALAQGATLALGEHARTPDSALFTPVVLTGVTVDNPISRQELFGPVACVMSAGGDDEAVQIANATPFGLSGAVHSRDVERAIRVARQIRTGMIHINGSGVADEAAVPFGGVGASGHGRLNGQAAHQTFTRTRWLSVNRGSARYPF